MYVVIGICMVTLVGGLGYRQLVLKEEYVAAETRQNYRRILMPGPRGNIYDRHGELLVGNRPLFSAVVYLNELRSEFREEYFRLARNRRQKGLPLDRLELNTEARENIVQYYINRINSILDKRIDVDPRRIERHFSQNLLLPFPLVEDLTMENYARLVEQVPVDSPIQLIASTARHYPYNEAAAHALGYVSKSREISAEGVPGDQLLTFRHEGIVGRSGIEFAFNQHLQGKMGGEIWTVDPGGFQDERVVYEQPAQGEDLTTSLDIRLQQAAERAMENHTGAVVAIELESAEVLALASKPAYDLNDLSPFLSSKVDQQIRKEGGWMNRATQGLYPPGSTFKLVTATAALRANAVDESTVIECSGSFMVGRRVFRCHRRSGHGPETLVEAIRDSCNVFFYDTGTDIGVWAIANEAQRFHLDQPTGIELPHETKRMTVPDPEWKADRLYGESWFQGDTANLSIGQGYLLVTPLQMASFVASLAKEITYMKPTIIHQDEPDPERFGPPIDLPSDELDLVLEGMRISGERGTARLAGGPNLQVAGKTGTAQVRKDGKPTTLAWLVGYAPAKNPRIAVAVLIEGIPDSLDEYGGGSTAAPIAKAIFQTFMENEN